MGDKLDGPDDRLAPMVSEGLCEIESQAKVQTKVMPKFESKKNKKHAQR